MGLFGLSERVSIVCRQRVVEYAECGPNAEHYDDALFTGFSLSPAEQVCLRLLRPGYDFMLYLVDSYVRLTAKICEVTA